MAAVSRSWSSVEPVLRATWAIAESQGLRQLDGDLIAEFMDVDVDQVNVALEVLSDTDYLETTVSMGPHFSVDGFTEKGLQAVGGWPTATPHAITAALLAAVDRQIDDSPDEEQRTRLEKFRDATAGMGRELLLRVVTEAAAGRLPH